MLACPLTDQKKEIQVEQLQGVNANCARDVRFHAIKKTLRKALEEELVDGLGTTVEGMHSGLLRQRPLCHPRHCGHNSPLQFVLSTRWLRGQEDRAPCLGLSMAPRARTPRTSEWGHIWNRGLGRWDPGPPGKHPRLGAQVLCLPFSAQRRHSHGGVRACGDRRCGDGSHSTSSEA